MAGRKRQSKVGILWVFKKRILKAATLLKDGLQSADVVNGRFDHVNFWPVLQRRHRELQALEYEQVPRGRVLFHRKTETFRVYMDKTLHRAALQRRLLEEFDLPKSRTKFLTDPHYTTDPEELDRLFE